ncbi:TRPM8 channel-associated factor homolog [Plectropomus leopardus]|uniref:TRPM8 channel-associated factor homolog n=1 Tax=Plectropomus leopardus TaxID=160734 RepID=UPI001C4D6ECF|nr:TRPM8 channel-associated factor homolog [Plectropomus leopardus]
MSNQPIQNHHEGAYMSLIKGLRELDLCGPCVPSNLVLTGDHAFPLAMNSKGQAPMAASLYGSGRIVVLGHEGYLTAFPALVENALIWLRGDGSENLSVGVQLNSKAVADNLSKSSFDFKVVAAFSDKLGVGVYVTDAYSVGADMNEVVAFLKSGGGVLIAGQAWSWAADHPKENVFLQFEGNKVSGVAGIYFSEHHGEVECLPVHPQIPSSWMAVVIGKDFDDDLELLLHGVSEFDLQDAICSDILVHGPLAFPIGTTEDGRAFLAGAYYGQGRVIVISHEGLLKRETLAPFWNNAIHWLDKGRKGEVGILPDLGQVFNLYSKLEFNCKRTHFRKDLSVFVCTAYNDHHAEEIQDFVAEGGGLLIGGHAWYWAQTHQGQNPMTDFPGNKILNKMGLSLHEKILDEGSYKAPMPSQVVKDSYHFRNFLHRFAGHVTQGYELTEHEEKCFKRFSGDCTRYLHMKAHDCSSYAQVLSTLTDILKLGMPQVCDSCPVKSPKDHLLLRVGVEVYKVCPDPDALMPYLIKHNPLMPVVYNHRVKIDVRTAGGEEWISTGLYLSPGMKTYMAMPKEIVKQGWKIQIGCHTDYLNAGELKRAPCVHEQFPVTSEMMQVWNLWGGLIYLVAPPKTQVDGVEVIVQMAVPAPYYKSGVTTPADWSLLRTAPSPWAELEFENIILTVPSDAVRSLDRPDELATFWDEIMRGIADLAVKPHKFPRKERFVTDVQISYGWMHAGYPIMAHKGTAVELVNKDHARKSGLWGPIHELGHNQQRDCWEFPSHTTECTCNLWSVYVHEEVLGINRAKAHEAMTVANRNQRADKYAKEGKKLSNWQVWVALETYMQLQEKFGWDAFKKVFAAYHKMSSFPSKNKEKMNLYAETFSQAVEMNLCGFFKSWGWPIERATQEKLSKLPPWSDHPMVQYD